MPSPSRETLPLRDIYLFVRDTVFEGARSDAAKQTCAKNALACEAQVLADIQASGYRITKRIRLAVDAELRRIHDEAVAVTTVPVEKLSRLSMVAGGEATITKVIDDGTLKEWVGFGWIDLCAATDADRTAYPQVVRPTPAKVPLPVQLQQANAGALAPGESGEVVHRPNLVHVHEHNVDPTAKLVWVDRQSGDLVFGVRSGFIASVGRVEPFAPAFLSETFGSVETARAALACIRQAA